MSDNSLQKIKFNGSEYQSVQSFRQRKRHLIERLGAGTRRNEYGYNPYKINDTLSRRSNKNRTGKAKTHHDGESYRVSHTPGTTWAEKNPDKVCVARTSSTSSDPTASAHVQSTDRRWRKTLNIAIFGYSVFAIISCTTAFKMFGIASIAFALVYIGGLILIATQARQLLSNPVQLLLAVSFPFFALASIFWGVEPETSLRHATQLTFTALIGASIGCALKPHSLIMAMSVAFVGLIVLSVANLWLQIVPAFQQRDYLVGNEYFTGIFAHKNTLGLVLCLAALCLAYLASSSIRPRWPFAIALIALLPIFLFARSTTSIAIYALVLCMPLLCLYLQFKGFRLLIFLSLCSGALALIILMELMSVSLIDVVLELAGKGRDISGRTSLWAIATEQIQEEPWLGVGYQSYWSTALFSRQVEIIRGFLEPSIEHFHNTWLETLVGVGILGLLSLVAIPAVLFCRFLSRLCQPDWSPIDVAGLFFVVLILIRANVETTIYYQHNTENLILIAMLFSTIKLRSSSQRIKPALSTANKFNSNGSRQNTPDSSHSQYRHPSK